jgi:hypothetical protein
LCNYSKPYDKKEIIKELTVWLLYHVLYINSFGITLEFKVRKNGIDDLAFVPIKPSLEEFYVNLTKAAKIFNEKNDL